MNSAATEPRAPAHRVEPRARWYWAVRALFGWIVVLGAEAAVMLPNATPDVLMMGVFGGTGLVGAAHVAVMPQWRYRVHRWEDTPRAVYTQTGWFTQERRIAPVTRIQTVDTHRGPIEQLFSLSNVTVTTASAAGPLKIYGLSRATADRLSAELTERTRSAGDDAT